MRRTVQLLVGVVVALAALGVGQARRIDRDFHERDLLAAAIELAAEIGMPADRRDAALGRATHLVADGTLRAKYGDEGARVRGIFAYQMGEGGLIVKVKRGKGALRFAGEERVHRVSLKSVSVGAVVGGSSEWGFGLVLGLSDPELFGGDYSGSTRGATAGRESLSITELAHKNPVDAAHVHHVVLVGSASGLSANAGSASLSIQYVE